jgi:membrane associated rhomboid family serine protease
MTPTPVGMRCPECSRERTKVRTLRTSSTRYSVTEILVAINVIAFIIESASGAPVGGGGGGSVWRHGVLYGPALTGTNDIFPYSVIYSGTHQYWRLLTAGFLHDGILHIAFNMFFLYFMGQILEPAIGRVNFVFVYFASLLTGSFGALLFQPRVPTVGASTACFGILGALLVVAHARRISIWQSGLGPTLLINIVFSLTFRGISLGGHLGGLAGGLICGWLVVEVAERRRNQPLALAGCVVVAIIGVIAAIAVAGSSGLTTNGTKL